MKKYFRKQRTVATLMGVIICLFIVLFSGCLKKDNETSMVVTGNASQPRLPVIPYSYFNGDNDMATLGRVLFYDRNVSLNNAISCGSCHIQSHGFADKTQFSQGLNNGYTARNTLSLVSTPNHNHFWDGRAGDYDTAVFMPVMNHVEMDMFNLNILPDKLSKLPYYSALFQSAFGTSEINVYRIRQALSSFVSNLNSFNNKFDQNNLNDFEKLGWQIFTGKGRCYNCHNGQNLNGYSTDYENIGLDVNYTDFGRGKITHNSNDNGKFNVPSLRNVAVSGPYMHDGRYKTLREVIDHYSEGIQNSTNLSWVFRDLPNSTLDSLGSFPVSSSSCLSSFPVVKLSLTETEKKNLEAFLNSLTDESFITDPKFSNPF